MSSPPNTYVDTPISSHTLAQDQPVIRSDITYLANTLGTSNSKNGDHQISFGGVDTNSFEGRHRQVCFNSRSVSAPTVGSISDGTDSIIYSFAGNIFASSSINNGPFQLTNFKNNTALFGTNTNYQASGGGNARVNGGYSFLPGGLLVNYGGATILNPGGTIKVVYAIPFTSSYYSIVVTPRTSTAIGGGNHDWDIGNGDNQTYFNLTINGNYNAADTFYFYAVGV